MTTEESTARIAELETEIRVLKRILLERRLNEYPPGHPEEPNHLKKFREQNPNWRDYQD